MHLLVPSYKITKAALNMLTKQYALEFADAGFTFVVISPGVSGNL
jgi:NAD(P)-dependent dehydrogenase (short-subunit alcohol dehydrogenase family)